jgi:hypothetical protein
MSYNGINILHAPAFAPEEQDVYSRRLNDHLRSDRSEMFHVCSHDAPTERTSFQSRRARNIVLLRSKSRCVKYVDTAITARLKSAALSSYSSKATRSSGE